MELIVSRLPQSHHGLVVALKDGDDVETIALINGNKPDFTGPVILTSIDQDVVYGLSHREVVSRIYATGPQMLITSKELGHKLYEHGMKAALGKVKVGHNTFTTNLETYYSLTTSYGPLNISLNGGVGVIVRPAANYARILLAPSGFDPKVYTDGNRIDFDKISTQVSKRFDIDTISMGS